MPGTKGLEVSQVLRPEPRMAELPIVIHSGNVDPDFEDAAKRSGATEVWVKGLCDLPRGGLSAVGYRMT
jgi:CheY-like chemotaxis protein